MTVVGILEHLPTEATLVQTEKNRERQQWYRERERAHAAGDHSLRVPRGGTGSPAEVALPGHAHSANM